MVIHIYQLQILKIVCAQTKNICIWLSVYYILISGEKHLWSNVVGYMRINVSTNHACTKSQHFVAIDPLSTKRDRSIDPGRKYMRILKGEKSLTHAKIKMICLSHVPTRVAFEWWWHKYNVVTDAHSTLTPKIMFTVHVCLKWAVNRTCSTWVIGSLVTCSEHCSYMLSAATSDLTSNGWTNYT